MIAGITVFGIVCYYGGLHFSAEKRVRAVCAKFTPGLSVAAVAAIAQAHGMNAPSNAPTTYVAEVATSGRYGCRLEFKDGVLQNFCSRCGIYTHHRRRSKPNQYGYNLGCLDGVDPNFVQAVPVSDGIDHPADRPAAAGN